MTRDVALAVSCCLLAVAVVAVVLLVRERQISARLRHQVTGLGDDLHTRDEEIHHLATVRLPELIGSSAQDFGHAAFLLHARLTGTTFGNAVRTVTELFGGSLQMAQEHADVSAKTALKSSMRALQALANEQQLSISQMQDRHHDSEVLQDLLVIDHTNSQFARRAQVIAVLCGSWPGRQRAASSLIDAVRGATSRIRDYRRVQVHSQVNMAVTSRAVEPVVLALAELLDNAARHSQPNSSVQVSVQPTHNGVAIVIDDAGVGMVEQEIQNARGLLIGNRSINIQQLGDPPQFGFAVIGVLAARYGFRVTADTQSPYGGVRAVLFLPNALLTHIQDDGPVSVPAHTSPAMPSTPEMGLGAPRPRHAAAQQAGEREPVGTPASSTTRLPQRRRRQPLPNGADNVTQPPAAPSPPVADPRARPEATTTAERTASDAAAVIGAFARGTRAGRVSSDSPAHEGNSHS